MQQGSASGEQKGKGLDFMGLRIEVFKKYRHLKLTRQIGMAESNVIDLIIEASIGAQNEIGKFYPTAPFLISELMESLNYKYDNKVYEKLNLLKKKRLITWEIKDGIHILGLNPDCFGQILNDRQHKEAVEKPARWAVDNSKKRVDKLKTKVPSRDKNGPESGPNKSHVGTEMVPSQDSFEHKKSAYTSSIPIYTSPILPETGTEESCTLSEEEQKREQMLAKEAMAVYWANNGVLRGMPR